MVIVPGNRLRERLANVPFIRVPVPKENDSQEAARVPPEAKPNIDAPLVEADCSEFRTFSIQPATQSGFDSFLDGTERVRTAFYVGLLPAMIAATGAAICKRVGSKFDLEPVSYKSRTLLISPRHEEVVRALHGGPWELEAVEAKAETGALEFETLARKHIQRVREGLEVALGLDYDTGNLLVDGGIGNLIQRPRRNSVVGIVKSHGRLLVGSPDRLEILFNLKHGERTTLLKRESDPKQGAEAYTCYLKLNDKANEGPFYGLVRIEVPADQESVERIDEIASWILAERFPMALPERRADRLIYPISLVEQVLRSREPNLLEILL